MRKEPSKKVNQTFSIPLDISNELHAFVKRREMSQFVSEAIQKELEAKKTELRRAYFLAKEDNGQKEAANDWNHTIADGSDAW